MKKTQTIKIDNKSIKNQLIEDYNCNTILEKSLCEVISLNYWKIIEISEILVEKIKSPIISKYKWKYLVSISLELERAHRCYLAWINSLIEIKRPKLDININNKLINDSNINIKK